MNPVTVVRTRRGRGKPNLNCTFLYSNINGFKGKSASVVEILSKTEPTIVVLCEIKLANVNKVKEIMDKEYEVIHRCIKSGKGGIVIAAKRNIFASFIDITNSENKNILVGRVALGAKFLRIIAGYAPQEEDLKEVREEFFEDLSMEITKSKLSDDEFMIIGGKTAPEYDR